MQSASCSNKVLSCCAAAEGRERELHRSKSEAAEMMKTSPLEWFGRWQESSATPGSQDYPSKLGKVGRHMPAPRPLCPISSRLPDLLALHLPITEQRDLSLGLCEACMCSSSPDTMPVRSVDCIGGWAARNLLVHGMLSIGALPALPSIAWVCAVHGEQRAGAHEAGRGAHSRAAAGGRRQAGLRLRGRHVGRGCLRHRPHPGLPGRHWSCLLHPWPLWCASGVQDPPACIVASMIGLAWRSKSSRAGMQVELRHHHQGCTFGAGS